MSFRLVSKSVTLNDLERRDATVMALILRYFTEFVYAVVVNNYYASVSKSTFDSL